MAISRAANQEMHEIYQQSGRLVNATQLPTYQRFPDVMTSEDFLLQTAKKSSNNIMLSYH